jgi:hypothetical protein
MGPLAQNPSQSAAWPKPLSMSSKYEARADIRRVAGCIAPGTAPFADARVQSLWPQFALT